LVVLLRGLKLDYNAIVVVFTFAGIQIGLCWNFHRIYVKLHNEFKAVVDRITENRKKLFSDWLMDLVNRAMSDIMKQQEEKRERYELKSPQYNDLVKHLYSLGVKAEEPTEVYHRTRESARTAHRYFMISGLTTLAGAIPAISGEQSVAILYGIFILPLTFAIIAWDDFYGSERKLIELRDVGE
jgi:hypothetical protein